MAEKDPDEVALAALWERNYDARTQEIIESLPLVQTWRCLDVGAGAGSMSAWLAERADKGAVLAVDVDTRYMDVAQVPSLTVRQADIAELDFEPGSFDLILARAVLQYLPDPARELGRLVRWLAPGGWLVVEDFYFMPSEDAVTPAGRAVVSAYVAGLTASGADMRWARRLPSALAREGLTSVGLRVTPLGPGQGADDDELMRLRMTLQGHRLVEAGLVKPAQLAEFTESVGRPEARDVTTLQFSVWGQRMNGALT